MKMNWIKKSSYLVPIIVCALGILGIAYYYFVGSFSKLSATEYVYIDDNDNLDSVCVKLEPIASDHGLSAFKAFCAQSYEKQEKSKRKTHFSLYYSPLCQPLTQINNVSD